MDLAPTDPGSHRSAPPGSGTSRAEGDHAERLPDLVLARLKEAGLVGEFSNPPVPETADVAADAMGGAGPRCRGPAR